jgi:hypothetical protein
MRFWFVELEVLRHLIGQWQSSFWQRKREEQRGCQVCSVVKALQCNQVSEIFPVIQAWKSCRQGPQQLSGCFRGRVSEWFFWMCWAVSEFGNWELIWAQGERLKSKVALGMKQKIEDLKIRRRKERINLILTAASHGDLAGFNHVFQASPIPQCDPHIWPVIHLPGSVVHVSKISRWYVICVHFRSDDLEINCSNRAEWAQWREGNVGRRVWEDSTSCCCLGRPGLPFQVKRAHHNTVANICWNILT